MTQLGHPDFVEEHRVLLRIPRVKDLQSVWIFLLHCASVRAKNMLLSVDPNSTGKFAQAHDDGVWQCARDM